MAVYIFIHGMQGYRSGVSRLATGANSPVATVQPSQALSANGVGTNGQALSAEFKDLDSRNANGAPSLVQPSYGMSQDGSPNAPDVAGTVHLRNVFHALLYLMSFSNNIKSLIKYTCKGASKMLMNVARFRYDTDHFLISNPCSK